MSCRNEESLSSNPPRPFPLLAGLLLCTISLFSLSSFAQTASTGALSGTVTDPSGAVVPGVNIKVTNEATGETRTVISKSDGAYAVPELAPGSYRIEAAAQGFKTGTKSGIRAAVTETTTFNVQLSVGTTGESVTVFGDADLVQTESSALGRVTDEKVVVGLPLATRNYTQILGLSPGVSFIFSSR